MTTATQLCSSGGNSHNMVLTHMESKPAYPSGLDFQQCKKLHTPYRTAQSSGGLQEGSGLPPSARTGVAPQATRTTMSNNDRDANFFTSYPSPGRRAFLVSMFTQ